jgi:hypothetical protein
MRLLSSDRLNSETIKDLHITIENKEGLDSKTRKSFRGFEMYLSIAMYH